IAPGFIDTEMTRATARRQGLDPDAVIASASKQIPVRRVGQPRDIANVIAFLSSEEAGFVSGQVIYVAGGQRS
ncbi:MAG: SDR family oxidoreductase, partial [Ktedonobacteraceae bacterium]